jgi:hypothetical protein
MRYNILVAKHLSLVKKQEKGRFVGGGHKRIDGRTINISMKIK